MTTTQPEPVGIITSHPAPLRIVPVSGLLAHDGDTFRVAVPMTYLIPGVEPGAWVEDVRLAHVNAAELRTPQGAAAQQQVQKWLEAPEHQACTLHVWGREKYGRLLADMEASDGALLSAFVATLPGTVPMGMRVGFDGRVELCPLTRL